MAKRGNIFYTDKDFTDSEVQQQFGFPVILILHDNNSVIKKISAFDENGAKSIYDFSLAASKDFVTQSIADAVAGLNDNVLEFNSYRDFPQPGEVGNIYIALDVDQIFVWNTESQSYVQQSWDAYVIQQLQTNIASVQMAFQNLQNSKLDKGSFVGTAQDLYERFEGKIEAGINCIPKVGNGASGKVMVDSAVSEIYGKIGIGLGGKASEKLEVNGNVKATGFKTSTGTTNQALTANGGTFDLTTKLDKGTYVGTAQDLKNSIDSKLNKPTTTSNTTSYPFVVGEDGNGNSARLPAGDLGKNFFNSDLSNTTARNHTMNAGVTVNTLGNPHTLSGLPNKNADITNFRKVRVQNASGLDSVVDSKNLLTDGLTSMTDAEKDAWRLAQRKTGENYSTGVPVVNGIYPYIQSKENVSFLHFTITGSSLLINALNPQTKVLFTRTHDINGQVVSEPKYDATGNVNVSLITVNNITLEVPAINLNTGKYIVEVVHNNLTSLVTSEFYIHTSVIQQSLPTMTIAQSLGSTSPYLQQSTLGTNNTISAFMFKTSEILNMTDYPNGVVIELNINLFTKSGAGNSHYGYVYLSSTADAITSSPPNGALGIFYVCNGNGRYWTDFGDAVGQGGSFPLTIIIKGGYAQVITNRLGYVQIINKSNIFNGGISLNIGTNDFNSSTSPIFKVSLVSIKKITN